MCLHMFIYSASLIFIDSYPKKHYKIKIDFMEVKKLRKILLSISSITLVLLLLIPIGSATFNSGTEFTTLILTIDKSKFNPQAITSMGGIVSHITDIAPIAIIKIPYNAVQAVKKLPGVIHVSEDALVQIYKGPPQTPPGKDKNKPTQPPETLPWGVDYIDAEIVWSNLGVTGSAGTDIYGTSVIEVAIIDTGIDMDHPDLQQNLKYCATVLTKGVKQKISIGDCDDKNGHGTHVAGTIAALDNEIGVIGVAPTTDIYMIKAFGPSGSAYISDIIVAIDLAVKGPDGVVDSDNDGLVAGDPDDDAPEVISMSFGSNTDVQELHNILATAYSYGIVLVAASGNEGDPQPSYPARYPEVIAVGAVDSSGNVPYWSNRNPEITAPGVNILSTYPDDTYETLSGTSMATPHVSGTIALIQASRLLTSKPLLPPGTENDIDNTTVRGILHQTATDKGQTGYDEEYGYGIINAYQSVIYASYTT